MPAVGEIEKTTQQRVMKLLQEELGYRDLGDRTDREGNSNIEAGDLLAWLKKRGVEPALAERAIYLFQKTAGDTSRSLYDRNREVYDLLRYGVQVKEGAGENTKGVFLIDWAHQEENDFAVAEEVTIAGADAKAHTKRPDVVIYVNGIALGVLELKRSTVSVAEGIRQNLDNQKKVFIEHFFSTIQWVMAGNDTEGLRYAAIDTKEKHWLAWKEPSGVANPLDRALLQLCAKVRFLELIHDFTAFDAGTKKLCRHNQYFGVKAAQARVRSREGGIVWHTQGSGKSLTMVWLARWIRENTKGARTLIITDRTELDDQIEKVFHGVREDIYRTKSGADLIETLNAATPEAAKRGLVCSLVHKFGGRDDNEADPDVPGYIADLKRALPPDFSAKGNLFVFVDECHRTQSGDLHEAMKAILPTAMFIGFTGTPLLRSDKRRSIETFGTYIHTYKFDEAVKDGVVVDLRYEARDIDQRITSQKKIDQWFEAKTRGLTNLAKAQLKERWGTLQKVLSSQSRLDQIVADILMDMATRDRLKSGRGNALLVSGSIYQACKFFELFEKTELKGRCAIVTSYRPSANDIKGEETGEGLTEKLRQYGIYRRMLADWFNESEEEAGGKAELFEKQAKKRFIEQPAQLKLLIVVDKLLTGFDAPSATYLYIDKEMHDHGLFQAICRVNRLDTEDKEYGTVIDYKDLFKSLKGAYRDYTSGALDGYDKEDVAGLLKDRLAKAKERLDETREQVKVLCEPVEPPRDSAAYLRYFCALDSGDAEQLNENEPRRLSLYKQVAAFVRAYANLADEMQAAGYTAAEWAAIRSEAEHYEKVRAEVKLASGDYIDLKSYEPAMRHLLDAYIQADESRKISAFDDVPLVELLIEKGAAAADALPDGIRKNREAVAETIENNVRKLIIDEHPINPKYYDRMSALLDALIKERRTAALDYEKYLKRIADLARQVRTPGGKYPATLDTPAKRALYDNLGADAGLALAVDAAICAAIQDDWRGNAFKLKRVRNVIRGTLDAVKETAGSPAAPYRIGPEENLDTATDRILVLVRNQNEY
jgi:type I restriction enzyme R subunit